MSRKPADYCKIVQYLEYNNQPLFEAVNVLCAWSEFRKPKGVTLLEPDAKTCKDIRDLAFKNSDKALESLRRHIIPTFVPDVGKLTPGFTNSQSERQEAKGSSSKVSVGKATISAEPAWKPRERIKTREQVFKLSGSLDAGQKSTKGGAVLQADEVKSLANSDMKGLIKVAEERCRTRGTGPDGVDSYLSALVSFLQYCETKGLENDVKRVFQLGSPVPAITWWIMLGTFSPNAGSSNGGSLLTDKMAECLKDWLLSKDEITIAPAEYYRQQFDGRFSGQLDSASRNSEIRSLLVQNANLGALTAKIGQDAKTVSQGGQLWGRSYDACSGVPSDLILSVWESRFLAEKAYMETGSLAAAASAVKCVQQYSKNTANLLTGLTFKVNQEDSVRLFWGSLVYYLCGFHGGESDSLKDDKRESWNPTALQTEQVAVSEQDLLGGRVLEIASTESPPQDLAAFVALANRISQGRRGGSSQPQQESVPAPESNNVAVPEELQ